MTGFDILAILAMGAALWASSIFAGAYVTRLVVLYMERKEKQ